MSFITPDDTNIIMDTPDFGPSEVFPQFTLRSIPLDDLRRFRDAGATVALEFAYWHIVEPSRGVYDWRMVDEMVERPLKAGMKVLLMLPTTVARWAPDEWYVWDEAGHVYRQHLYQGARQTWGCMSPWNPDARGYLLDFIRLACNRYNCEDVLCINAQSQEGEALMPPAVLCAFDPAATRSFQVWCGDKNAVPHDHNPQTMAWLHATLRDLLIDEQMIFCGSHPSRTVFSSMHPIYTDPIWVGSGNYDLTYYMDAIRDFVRPAQHCHILFAWYDHGFERFRPWMAGEQEKGTRFIVGGEWCDGLKRNTPRAIAEGAQALLTAPIHPFLKVDRVEPWMVDAVRESRETMQLARELDRV